MKKRTTLLLIATALISAPPIALASEHDAGSQESGKSTPKVVSHQISETADTIKNYTADKRDEAAGKAKAALDALDVRISALEARIDQNWETMDKAAREQARSTLDALHRQRVQVAEWYGALKNSTAKAWEHMKRGFSDAYGSLRSASEKAEREYQGGEKDKGNRP